MSIVGTMRGGDLARLDSGDHTRPAIGRLVRIVRGTTDPTGSADETWREGWAVRRDWPQGQHEFFAFRKARFMALRSLARDVNFWARGPVWPRLSIVRISRRDFRLHHSGLKACFSPDCPQPEPRNVEVAL